MLFYSITFYSNAFMKQRRFYPYLQQPSNNVETPENVSSTSFGRGLPWTRKHWEVSSNTLQPLWKYKILSLSFITRYLCNDGVIFILSCVVLCQFHEYLLDDYFEVFIHFWLLSYYINSLSLKQQDVSH